MPRLPVFIRENMEEILAEWESFARTFPTAEAMDVEGLRDHAAEMLKTIADDLETTQTAEEQEAKGKGESDSPYDAHTSPAQLHGAGRAESGFTIGQMVAEFRALRASVINLWTKSERKAETTDLQDMIRFNEAIDQAISESVVRYTRSIGDSKERLLAIVGHDLRTPLGAIVTATRFMLDTGELREPHLTLVTRVAGSAKRMTQLVADLLDFTRTRFGDTIPIIKADTDVRRVVQDVVAEVATFYPDAKVQVEAGGDLRGSWDCDRLAQALTNLIGNAVQHGEEGAPIKVVARGERAEVVISVQNQGAPIPGDKLKSIFQAGSEGSTTRRAGGHLGLGLYIVRKIVEGHGGRVEVTSAKDEGTTFAMHIPR